jgi:hypothetical protein
MMLQNSSPLLKTKVMRDFVKETKSLDQWENVVQDLYQLNFRGYNILKRKISKNYWQFTVANDITSCTFKMYEKER